MKFAALALYFAVFLILALTISIKCYEQKYILVNTVKRKHILVNAVKKYVLIKRHEKNLFYGNAVKKKPCSWKRCEKKPLFYGKMIVIVFFPAIQKFN